MHSQIQIILRAVQLPKQTSCQHSPCRHTSAWQLIRTFAQWLQIEFPLRSDYDLRWEKGSFKAANLSSQSSRRVFLRKRIGDSICTYFCDCVLEFDSTGRDVGQVGNYGHRNVRNVLLRAALQVGCVDLSVITLSGDGYNIMSQMTKPSVLSSHLGENNWEHHFVMPYLPANATAYLLTKTVSDGQSVSGFHFNNQAGKAGKLNLDSRSILRYMYEDLDRSSSYHIGETYKIYRHVYGPAGSLYVTQGTGGLVPHHRGLYFGFNRISYRDQKAET